MGHIYQLQILAKYRKYRKQYLNMRIVISKKLSGLTEPLETDRMVTEESMKGEKLK